MKEAVYPQIEALCDALLVAFVKEIPLYEEFLAILHKEREALENSRWDELGEWTARKENCILKLQILEESRRKLMGNIYHALGVGDREPLFPMLGDIIEEEKCRRIMELREELKTLAEKIREINRGNMLRIETALGVIHNSLSLLTHLLTREEKYTSGGQGNAASVKGRLVSLRG